MVAYTELENCRFCGLSSFDCCLGGQSMRCPWKWKTFDFMAGSKTFFRALTF